MASLNLRGIFPPLPAGRILLAGGAGFLLPALATGAAGGILASANIAPGHCLSIFGYRK